MDEYSSYTNRGADASGNGKVGCKIQQWETRGIIIRKVEAGPDYMIRRTVTRDEDTDGVINGFKMVEEHLYQPSTTVYTNGPGKHGSYFPYQPPSQDCDRVIRKIERKEKHFYKPSIGVYTNESGKYEGYFLDKPSKVNEFIINGHRRTGFPNGKFQSPESGTNGSGETNVVSKIGWSSSSDDGEPSTQNSGQGETAMIVGPRWGQNGFFTNEGFKDRLQIRPDKPQDSNDSNGPDDQTDLMHGCGGINFGKTHRCRFDGVGSKTKQ